MSPTRYACSNGHTFGVLAGGKVPTICPVTPSGKSCDGTLRRIGPGTRPKAATK